MKTKVLHGRLVGKDGKKMETRTGIRWGSQMGIRQVGSLTPDSQNEMPDVMASMTVTSARILSVFSMGTSRRTDVTLDSSRVYKVRDTGAGRDRCIVSKNGC